MVLRIMGSFKVQGSRCVCVHACVCGVCGVCVSMRVSVGECVCVHISWLKAKLNLSRQWHHQRSVPCTPYTHSMDIVYMVYSHRVLALLLYFMISQLPPPPPPPTPICLERHTYSGASGHNYQYIKHSLKVLL